MATVGDDDLIRPDAARRISEEKEMEKLKQLLEKQRKAEMEAHALHQTFIERGGGSGGGEAQRLGDGPRRLGHGEREVIAPLSDWCTDKGRAINNFEPNWPETLTGFAKRAYDYYEKELPPGYKSGPRSSTSPAVSRATSASSSVGDAPARGSAGDRPHPAPTPEPGR